MQYVTIELMDSFTLSIEIHDDYVIILSFPHVWMWFVYFSPPRNYYLFDDN